MEKPKCSTEGCARVCHGRGLCQKHYDAFMHANPHIPRTKRRKRNEEAPNCSAEGCEKKSRTRGMCVAHYARKYRNNGKDFKNPIIRKPGKRLPCSVEGCSSISTGKTFCSKHYYRFKHNGSPLGLKKRWVDDIRKRCLKLGCHKPQYQMELCAYHFQEHQSSFVLEISVSDLMNS